MRAPIEQEVPKHRNKKDTKKWCMGKLGVEHVPVVFKTKGIHSYRTDLCCKECGKVLEVFVDWPVGYFKKPDWLKEKV